MFASCTHQTFSFPSSVCSKCTLNTPYVQVHEYYHWDSDCYNGSTNDKACYEPILHNRGPKNCKREHEEVGIAIGATLVASTFLRSVYITFQLDSLTSVHSCICSGLEDIVLSIWNSIPPAPGRHDLERAVTCKEWVQCCCMWCLLSTSPQC